MAEKNTIEALESRIQELQKELETALELNAELQAENEKLNIKTADVASSSTNPIVEIEGLKHEVLFGIHLPSGLYSKEELAKASTEVLEEAIKLGFDGFKPLA